MPAPEQETCRTHQVVPQHCGQEDGVGAVLPAGAATLLDPAGGKETSQQVCQHVGSTVSCRLIGCWSGSIITARLQQDCVLGRVLVCHECILTTVVLLCWS